MGHSMNKNIITGVIIAVVFFVAGYFLHPYMAPEKTATLPTAPTIQSIGPVRPDVVKVYLPDPMTIQQLEDKNKQFENLKRILIKYKNTETDKPKEVEIIYKSDPDVMDIEDLPVFESSKLIKFTFGSPDTLATSNILAWSHLPVDSFQNTLLVNWDDYIKRNYEPQVIFRINKAGDTGKFKGLLMGSIAVGGIASQNEYMAVGAIITAGLLYLFW